jgi:hypothetical protein
MTMKRVRVIARYGDGDAEIDALLERQALRNGGRRRIFLKELQTDCPYTRERRMFLPPRELCADSSHRSWDGYNWERV